MKYEDNAGRALIEIGRGDRSRKMFMRIGLVPIIAAASFVVVACEQRSAEAPANNATSAEANDAEANAVLAQGAPTSETCGGIANIQCSAEGDFCKTPVGQCGVADGQGVCTPRPQVCTRQWDPVCGCDGRTYGNACEADAAGVNVQAAGECPSSDG